MAPPGTRPRTRSFSVAWHGEDEARTLAESWLLEQAKALEDSAPAAPDPSGPASVAPPLPESSFLTPAYPPPNAMARQGNYHEDAFYGRVRVVSPKHALWRVHLSRAGRALQAPFPDLTYGAETAALAMARAWRDVVQAMTITNIEVRQTVRRNRREDMPGVYYNTHRGNWSAIVTLTGQSTVKRSLKVSAHSSSVAPWLKPIGWPCWTTWVTGATSPAQPRRPGLGETEHLIRFRQAALVGLAEADHHSEAK